MKQKYFLFSIAATALLSLGATSCTLNFGDEEEETWYGSDNPDNPQDWQHFNPEDPNSTAVDPEGNLHVGWFVYKPLTANTAEFSRYEQEQQSSMVIPETITVGGKTYTITAIGEHAFGGWNQLSSVTLPATITTIGNRAFSDCQQLTTINLPEGLVIIGEGALSRTGITSLTIPSTVTTIGNWAFSECKGLTTILIPASVTKLGDGAFSGCTGVTEITIQSKDLTLDNWPFANENVKKVTLNCKTISENAFSNWPKLAEVVLGDDVETIGNNAFYSCALTKLTIPNSVTTIGNSAFGSNKKLTEVEIGSGMTSIGNWAFGECNLTSITIPASVTNLGDMAFGNNLNLKEVKCLATTPPVIDIPWEGASGFDWELSENGKLYVPAASVDAYKTAKGWKEFKNIIAL